jgi:hypothetical protein
MAGSRSAAPFGSSRRSPGGSPGRRGDDAPGPVPRLSPPGKRPRHRRGTSAPARGAAGAGRDRSPGRRSLDCGARLTRTRRATTLPSAVSCRAIALGRRGYCRDRRRAGAPRRPPSGSQDSRSGSGSEEGLDGAEVADPAGRHPAVETAGNRGTKSACADSSPGRRGPRSSISIWRGERCASLSWHGGSTTGERAGRSG